MSRLILTLLFLNLSFKMPKAHNSSAKALVGLEKKIEFKFIEYSHDLTKWLENINDKHLKNSDLGRLIRYEDTKMKLGGMAEEARASKKLALALLPVIFHVGATTTWLMVTTILAAKSVAIGLILLIFKIAVSSAKISSFFTAWKVKNHHGYGEISWSPHHDHHASFSDFHHHPHKPDWRDTIPSAPELVYGESKKIANKQKY